MGRRVQLRGLAGLAVILAITAALTVDYAAVAKPAKGHHPLCASKPSKAKAKHAKRHATCKKKKASKRRGRPNGTKNTGPRGTTSPRTGTPPTGPGGTTGAGTGTGTGTGTGAGTGAATGTGTGTGTAMGKATLVVRVVDYAGHSKEEQPLRIEQLEPCERQANGARVCQKFETREHTVHVAPGGYNVAALNGPKGPVLALTAVTVIQDQQLEVPLEIP